MVQWKRWSWILEALGGLVALALLASAVSTKIGVHMLIDSTDGVARVRATPATDDDDEDAKKKGKGGLLDFANAALGNGGSAGADRRKELVEDIVGHNIFCPTCAPAAAEAVAGAGPGALVGDGLPKTTLALVLMATMEATDPKWSLATIYDSDQEVSGVYRPGEAVRDGVLVSAIERGRVLLRNGNAVEVLPLREGEVKKKKKKSKAKKKSKKKKKKSKAYVEGSEDAIQCPSENLCIVDRAFVEKLLANPAALAKQARVIAAKVDGETKGFKFYGVRRDSLPKMLGLKNGDMLVSVNGVELTSMDRVMGLYSKLRHASNLSVTIDRKGKTINKEIQIK